MKNANDIVKDIARTKLSEYGAGEVEQATESTTAPAPRVPKYAKPARKSPYARKSTSQEDYAKLVPAIKTPSVLSKAKVDELLVKCRELPTPDSPQKNYAGYTIEEWSTLVDVISRYAADVCEGAGLQYKSFLSPEQFRKAMSAAMLHAFNHVDPYDKRIRFISVDGKLEGGFKG